MSEKEQAMAAGSAETPADGQSRIFVIGVDMENRPSEEIARDAVTKINALFEKLIKEDQARRAEAKENES